MRYYSLWDRLILRLDATVKIILPHTADTRPSPASNLEEADLDEGERRHLGGLMRINQVGEICAQALYQGQAIMARSPLIKQKLRQAAREEVDHLHWCRERLRELNTYPSRLNFLWYTGALLLGLGAGMLGDKVSLGFLAETESQVERHLARHLQRFPLKDKKSRAILERMRLEEITHGTTAKEAGAIPLPLLVQGGMQGLARLMIIIAYRI